MFVIKLPNGHLLVPESAVEVTGHAMGDAFVEIGPTDPEYARLAPHAVSEVELAHRRRRWQEGDEALRLEFERFLADRGEAGQRNRGEAGQ